MQPKQPWRLKRSGPAGAREGGGGCAHRMCSGHSASPDGFSQISMGSSNTLLSNRAYASTLRLQQEGQAHTAPEWSCRSGKEDGMGQAGGHAASAASQLPASCDACCQARRRVPATEEPRPSDAAHQAGERLNSCTPPGPLRMARSSCAACCRYTL